MDDYQANLIVFVLLMVIIFGILSSCYMIFGPTIINGFISALKNNSGNFTSEHILMMTAAILAIFFLFYFLFKTRPTVRESQRRGAL
jgi:uncharacterized BrkB/YihY/UPF0761 family membrane protein